MTGTKRLAHDRQVNVFDGFNSPPLDGATTWINSEPLGAADLRGRVVVVNFGTFTCINWLRQLPHVRAWSRAYRNDGLVVIGVHTPEFTFEHDLTGVRRAIQARQIDNPVAVDNEYAIWNAFHNRYWPALYFIDGSGAVRDEHFGEGRYEQSERTIQRLLGVERDLATVDGVGVEAEADWDHLRTPETYLGYWGGAQFASPNGLVFDARHTYELPGVLPPNLLGLGGDWTIEGERVALDAARGRISVTFQARDAHLVLSRNSPNPIPFRVLLDGNAPGRSHGVDVDADGAGTLDHGRMYQLVRQHDRVRDRTLDIEFLAPGAEAYAFTFG